MYTYMPSVLRLQPPHPTPLSHHRAPIWAPCAIQQLPTSYLFYSSVYIGLPRWQEWWRIHLPLQEMQEQWVWSLGQEDSLEEKMATHSSILAWKIPWTEATVHGVTKESDMTERLNTNMHSIYIIPISQFISLFCPLFPTLHVHTFVLYIFISLPALHCL